MIFMKKIVKLTVTLLLLSTLFACSSQKLVGKWTNKSQIIEYSCEFFEDSTCRISVFGIGVNRPYSVEKDEIHVYITDDKSMYDTYKFSIKNDQLTITDTSGTSIIFTKEK